LGKHPLTDAGIIDRGFTIWFEDSRRAAGGSPAGRASVLF
jgi:hypothetical protein